MVVSTYSYTKLKQLLGETISQDELRTILFDIGMELEAVVDDELTIELTAERLDLLGVYGLARAVKTYLKLGRAPQYNVHDSNEEVRLTTALKGIREHTVCAIVKNLQLDEVALQELIDVQEKLHATLGRGRKRGAIGIYPLDQINMPITFTAGSPDSIKFHPLQADREMTGTEIVTEHDTGKVYAHLLKDKSKYAYFIDAQDNILSMPPIINSQLTGRVTADTRDVFIECSGDELDVLEELLTYMVTLCAEMGGDVYSMKVVYPDESVRVTPQLGARTRTVRQSAVKNLLGIELGEKQLTTLLQQMMYTVDTVEQLEDDIVFTVAAPCVRYDLWHEMDIVDDIARAYGYNNLPLTLPEVTSIGAQLPDTQLCDALSEAAVGLGFLETYTFSLAGHVEQLEQMQLDIDTADVVRVANGNEVQTMLRTSLIPQQLSSIAINSRNPLPQKIFEGAFVVIPDASRDVKSRNELHFCGLIADKMVTFTQIRQAMDAILATQGHSVTVRKTEHPSYIKGRVGEVVYNDQVIGLIGELHPQVLTNFGISSPVAAFEINIEAFLE